MKAPRVKKPLPKAAQVKGCLPGEIEDEDDELEFDGSSNGDGVTEFGKAPEG